MTWWRKSVVSGALRRRFVVTLTGSEGMFSGVLTESDDTTWVFEDCKTDKHQPIAGRVFIDRINVAYLQQLEVSA